MVYFKMKKTYWLFLILIIGFLLRFLYIYFFIGLQASPEAHGYWLEKTGYNLSQGEGFGSQPHIPTAKKPPLYPAFLASIYLFFGHSFALARIGHIILAFFTCITTFYLSREISQEDNFPLFSSFLLAFDPTCIYVSGWFLTENLCMLFFSLTILYLIKIKKDPSLSNQILSGFFIGLTNLTRPNFLPFFLLVPVWGYFCFTKKEAVKIFSVIIITAITFISPWIIRNWKIYHGFIPMATGGGRIFLAGNNPQAIGDAILVSGSPRIYYSSEIPKGKEKRDWTKWKGDTWQNLYLTDMDPENFSSGLNEIEADKKYYRQGFNWIKENPLGFIRLLPKKIYCFWQYWSPHTRWPNLPEGLKITGLIYYIPFFILFLFGVISSFSRGTLQRPPAAFFTLYLVLIYSQINTLISFGDARQRFLFMPFLAVFAGFGLKYIISLINQKSRQKINQPGQ